MMHASSDSDITSVGKPSSASPRPYFVQSPSGADSHDDMDKCSSSSNGPCLSPSVHPRHSLTSSSSTAISRIFGNRRRWNKHYCDVVEEEGRGGDDDGGDGDYYGTIAYAKHCNCMIVGVTCALVFVGICLGFWGVTMHYKAQVSIKSLMIESVYYGQGSDRTGVPTKLMTVNCSASLMIHNPATYFGIQVSSHAANLIFSQVTIASGQLKKYYQPRKSTRIMWVRLLGKEVPLYGAGTALSTGSAGIELRLEFEVESRANFFKTQHTVRLSCLLRIHTHRSQQITFHNNSCKYL